MKTAFTRKAARCLALAALLALAACAGRNAPIRFYMLEPLAGKAPASLPGEGLPPIGVGPVTMAAYLNRPQIVTRSEHNRLQINETRQWAENLRTAFPRVLVQDLAHLLGSDRVFSFPWRREARIRYQVVVDVDRFDGEQTRTAVLQANWYILDTSKNRIVAKHRTDIREPADGIGVDKLVEAQSRALGQLSRQIADAVRTAVEGKT